MAWAFLINTLGTYTLSAIITKVTGQTTLEYLKPRLFEPLGIENPQWDSSPEGNSLGGYGLKLRTEDIAKFGQLYLQRGEWQGRRLIPAAWIDQATARQTANGSNPDSDWDQGYGFQFWRCRHDFYRGDGAFGQFCIVMPQYDTVVAITSGTGDMGSVMATLWDRLLPELRPAPLPDDVAAQAHLKDRLSKLVLPTVAGAATSPLAAKVSGRVYSFPANEAGIESVALETAAGGGTVARLKIHGTENRLPGGHGAWLKGEFALTPGAVSPAATSGAWTADDTFVIKICRYQTPFVSTTRLTFAGDDVNLEMAQNVAFGPNPAVKLTGHAK